MKIIIWYVLLGLFLGFLIVYLTAPAPKIVIKYPTIETIGNTTYVDENGQCYKYYAREIACPNINSSPNINSNPVYNNGSN